MPAVAVLTQSHQSHWSWPDQTLARRAIQDLPIVHGIIGQRQGVSAVGRREDGFAKNRQVTQSPGREYDPDGQGSGDYRGQHVV